MKLQSKYVLIVTVISCTILLAVCTILFSYYYATTRGLVDTNIDALNRSLLNAEAERVEKQLSDFAQQSSVVKEVSQLQAAIKDGLIHSQFVGFYVFDADSRVSLAYDQPSLQGQALSSILPGFIDDYSQAKRFSSDDTLYVLQPLELGGIVIGLAVKNDFSQMTMQTFASSANKSTLLTLSLVLFFIALILLSAWLVARNFARPIRRLAGYAKRIGDGELNTRIDNERYDELGDLAHSIDVMRSKLVKNSQQINDLSFTDQLTHLPNRTAFNQTLNRFIDEHNLPDQPFALLVIDLDNFKKINDTLGHSKGDDLLSLAGANMLQALKEFQADMEQIGEQSEYFLARLGSDEFAVLFSSRYCSRHVLNLATAIQGSLNHKFDSKLITLNYLYSSIGITLFPRDGSTANKLLKNANIALQVAKKSEHHECCHFSPSMQEALEHQYTLENELAKAIENDQLMLFYQPQIDLSTESIIGCEALIRWRHPALGMISPAEFLKIAEGTTMISDITKFVIARACRDINQYFSCLDDVFSVSINLSGLDFIMHDVAELIQQNIEQHQIKPKQLGLELTETSMLNDEGAVLEQLTKLSEQGHDIWLDDFGTGFSCLHHLRAFPITGIKIDRSFIQHLDQSTSEDNQINRALITFALALKLSVVTEGVETFYQHQLVQSFGATKSQGFYYGRAVPPAELFSYIKKQQKIA